MTIATRQSVTELAAQRQAVLDNFGNTDEANDPTRMDALYDVEDKIEEATFETDTEKLAGIMLPFELNDAPV
jgi:hypothetical protein